MFELKNRTCKLEYEEKSDFLIACNFPPVQSSATKFGKTWAMFDGKLVTVNPEPPLNAKDFTSEVCNGGTRVET